MNFDDRFQSVWRQINDIEIPDQIDDKCFYAQGFAAWVEQLITGIREPNVVLVNQAKILLMDKYFEWHRFVPSSHRLRHGVRGHTCIFQVFETAYERLKILELSLTPPLLFLPYIEPPVIPPSPIIGGIFLGEDLNRKDEEQD
jgi:hypothetical protein